MLPFKRCLQRRQITSKTFAINFRNMLAQDNGLLSTSTKRKTQRNTGLITKRRNIASQFGRFVTEIRNMGSRKWSSYWPTLPDYYFNRQLSSLRVIGIFRQSKIKKLIYFVARSDYEWFLRR